MSIKAERRPRLALFIAPPLTAALLAAVWSSNVVSELENVTIDRRFRARAESDPPPDPRIAMIGIGDYSLKRVGRWEEWTRDVHGLFSEKLALREPSVLAFDFFFPEASRDPAHDFAFADGLAQNPGAITGLRIDTSTAEEALEGSTRQDMGKTKPLTSIKGDRSKLLRGTRGSAPILDIAQSSWTGVVNCPPSETDGMRRRIPLVAALGDQVYPSLVLQVLMQAEEATPASVEIDLGNFVSLPKKEGGEWKIPIDSHGMMLINYRDTDRLEIFDYIALLGYLGGFEETGDWPAEFPPINNQIVFVGQSAAGLQDFGPTPYHSIDPLFRVQATALDNILQSDYLSEIPMWKILAIWLALAWSTVFILRRASVTLEVIIPAALVLGYIALAFYLFQSNSIVLPLVLPVIGFVLIHATVIGDRLVLELREKRYIKGVFSSYVSPEVVDQIVDSGQTPELGGERVNITILFSDIQGFSTFSEALEPEELVELMVEYLSELTDIITDSGGTLDKYIGDAIDAMYGAPLPLPNHAYHGVMSTILMQRKQADLRELWASQGRPDLVKNMRTRIGINTGPAVVGNMGSTRRFNYTMMGDNVNLGARCESGAKSYGVYTMITHETYQSAREHRDDIVYRYLDQIVVKGRTLSVKVYEVIEIEDLVSSDTKRCIELYQTGFNHYLESQWDEAIAVFEQSAELELFQPDSDPSISTNPSRVMVARCAAMKVNPPDGEWDGIYRMTSK